MDLTSIEIRPNVQTLYKLLGQEQLMEFYFGEKINFRNKYKNPFRSDKHATCFFKWSQGGNLYFIDYATEKIHYNCIDIAQMRTGYEYPDILYKIESDFQLKNFSLEDRLGLKIEVDSLKTVKPAEVKPASIKVKLTRFTQKDLEYWAQFGVTPSILKFFDIRRVDKAWIADNIWYINNDFDPCYRYKEKDKFKLYRPFAEKRVKFRTNFFGGMLEGYTQLPHKGSILVITKGTKDVMTLHSIGVNAVAVRSETTPISENAYELLKARFDNIYVWFDADRAGIEGSQKISEMFDIPVLYHHASLGKDISDIYKEHGKDKLIKLCQELKIL